MVEGVSVESIENTILLSGDGSSSRGIVEESELSECLSRFVGLQVGRFCLPREDFGALIVSRLDHVEAVAIFSFANDGISRRHLFLCHGINNNLEVIVVDG